MDGVANLTDEEKAMLAGEMGEPKRRTPDQIARVGAEDLVPALLFVAIVPLAPHHWDATKNRRYRPG